MAKRVGNNGNHGNRNSGRRPKAATILRRRLIANKIAEAEASFAFLVAVRDNDAEPTAQRVEAAREILNRVLGRPTEMRADENSELYKAHLERIKRVILSDDELGQTGAAESGKPGSDWIQAAAAPTPRS